jgi:hypothetical protein
MKVKALEYLRNISIETLPWWDNFLQELWKQMNQSQLQHKQELLAVIKTSVSFPRDILNAINLTRSNFQKTSINCIDPGYTNISWAKMILSLNWRMK